MAAGSVGFTLGVYPMAMRLAIALWYPTAAFAAVGAPEKAFHSPGLGTLCRKTNVRALSSRLPRPSLGLAEKAKEGPGRHWTPR